MLRSLQSRPGIRERGVCRSGSRRAVRGRVKGASPGHSSPSLPGARCLAGGRSPCCPSVQVPKRSQKPGSLWEISRGRGEGRSLSCSEHSGSSGGCVWRG